MAKHIILVHGRGLKPAASKYQQVMRRAMLRGLDLVSKPHAKRFRNEEVKFSLAYYGDYNNWISSTYSDYCGAILGHLNDTEFNSTPCIDHSSHETGLAKIVKLHDQNEDITGIYSLPI